MSKTRTIGGHFSPEAVEVNLGVTTLLSEWDIEQKWTRVRGERALTYRLIVNWNGKQGLMTGMFELPDELHVILAPNFSGLEISMGRSEEYTSWDIDKTWTISLYISWEKRFTAKPIGEMIVDGKEEIVYEDSAGKVLCTLDIAAPSFFRNSYVALHPKGVYTHANTYESAIKAETDTTIGTKKNPTNPPEPVTISKAKAEEMGLQDEPVGYRFETGRIDFVSNWYCIIRKFKNGNILVILDNPPQVRSEA